MIYKAITEVWQTVAKLNDKFFRHGGDFSGWESNSSLGISEKEGNKYQPSSDRIKKVLKELDIKSADSIIDIGCGKGRAMYMMSKFPFRKIVGYDLSENMVITANKNFNIVGKGDVCSAIIANAADFKEYTDYNYFYAFNPVPEQIFKKMMGNIEENIAEHPRKATFIYLNPVYKSYFDDSVKWECIMKKKALLDWNHVYVYRYVNR